jgi:hypothetical protein
VRGARLSQTPDPRPARSSRGEFIIAFDKSGNKINWLERLKKYCSHSERGFLGFGEALAKEQVRSNPVTEPKRSENPKRPLLVPPNRMAAVFMKMLYVNPQSLVEFL